MRKSAAFFICTILICSLAVFGNRKPLQEETSDSSKSLETMDTFEENEDSAPEESFTQTDSKSAGLQKTQSSEEASEPEKPAARTVSNSWSYTRIGKIDDLTGWEDALGSGNVTVTFSIEE